MAPAPAPSPAPVPIKAAEVQWFYYGGALMAGLALIFLYKELQVDAAWILSIVVLAFGVLSLRKQPSAAPVVGPAGLFLCGAVATAFWYNSQNSHNEDPFMAAVCLMALVAVLGVFLGRGQGIPVDDGLRLHRAAQWYAMTLGLMASSWTAYLRFLTFGAAEGEDFAGPRRMLLTMGYLVVGVVMVWVAVKRNQSYLKHAGLAFTASAFAKALMYDTSHMESYWRIGVLAVGGVVLMGMGHVLQKAQQEAQP